jgi:hypothetical protein
MSAFMLDGEEDRNKKAFFLASKALAARIEKKLGFIGGNPVDGRATKKAAFAKKAAAAKKRSAASKRR